MGGKEAGAEEQAERRQVSMSIACIQVRKPLYILHRSIIREYHDVGHAMLRRCCATLLICIYTPCTVVKTNHVYEFER